MWHLHVLGLRIARIRSRTQSVVNFKKLFSHSHLNWPHHNLLILLSFCKGKEAVGRKRKGWGFISVMEKGRHRRTSIIWHSRSKTNQLLFTGNRRNITARSSFILKCQCLKHWGHLWLISSHYKTTLRLSTRPAENTFLRKAICYGSLWNKNHQVLFWSFWIFAHSSRSKTFLCVLD